MTGALMNSPRGKCGSIYLANVITQELVEMRAVFKKGEVTELQIYLSIDENELRRRSNKPTTECEPPKVVTQKLSVDDIDEFLQKIDSFRKH